jgi:E3 ubiquitin-protein ligase ATL6/9/15/31/42/55
MAPAAPPTTTTWPRHGRTFLRPLLIVLAFAVRPASSQLFTPPSGYTFSTAFTPPGHTFSDAGGGGSGTLTLTTSLLFVALIVALFLLGFFSAYLRRCADAATGAGRGDGVALRANAAVSTATAAAFASAASGAGGRRRPLGLDAKTMEALPVLTYATARAVKAGRGALECAVCLAEFGDGGENLRLLPGCCHVFHAACIDVWLAAHVTCPVCRADLSDPAVADAGHVLAADLAAQAETTTTLSHHTAVNVDTSESTPGHQDTTSPETAEERVDRYTLRLPERLEREIEAARRHRRAMSAVTAAAGASSGRWTSEAFRTMSATRLSRRWSGLFRDLSRSRRSDPDSHGRVMPLHNDISHGDDEVEVVVVQGDAGTHMDKYYAHSLTFAGFLIDGDVAAGDWNPEVFQVSTAVPAAKAGSSQR